MLCLVHKDQCEVNKEIISVVTLCNKHILISKSKYILDLNLEQAKLEECVDCCNIFWLNVISLDKKDQMYKLLEHVYANDETKIAYVTT